MTVESGNYAQELVYENNSTASKAASFRLAGTIGGKVRVVYTTIPGASTTQSGVNGSAAFESNDASSLARTSETVLAVSNTAPLTDETPVTTGTYKEGDSRVWKMFNKSLPNYVNTSPNEDVTAVCRKVAQKGDHYFYFWVPADQWGSANGQMDATKIDRLAEKLATDDVSVYQSVRNLVGAEWGAHGYAGILDENTKDFHVVLDDLDEDGNPANGKSYTLGYFWPTDVRSVASAPKSNEALVINLDSRWLGYTPSGSTWDPAGEYALRVYSTMSHEMQHMVNYYQKKIRGGMATSETWPNEMLSILTQEVLAKELGWTAVEPAVTRFPSWLSDPNHSFVSWADVNAYASVYSYGTMLFRNLRSDCEIPAGSNSCDGNTANGFHAILASSNDGFRAIEDAFIHRGQRGTAEWLRMNGVTLAASRSTTPDGARFPAWTVAERTMTELLPWSDTRFATRPTILTALPATQAVGASVPVELDMPASGQLDLTVPANTWVTVLPNF